MPTPTVSPALTPSPAIELCPLCCGNGFLRLDNPVGHPRFGKFEPCPHPSHQADRLARLARVSEMQPGEMARRVSDIKRVEQRVKIKQFDPAQNKEIEAVEIRSNHAMLDAANQMLADPHGWLWIWGGPGNAKSEVLIAMVNELNERGHGPAVYTKFTKLVDYMRDAFDERKRRADDPGFDLGYIARFNRLKSIKVLAIDEMDKVRETPFLNDFRFDFLDDRYRQGVNGQTITLFASNDNPATLPDPIWDRVRDGRFRVVHNQAASARPYMRRKGG